MSESAVISNTSPLFYLHQIGRLDVLRELYGKVLIPPGVESELAADAAKGLDVPALTRTSWLEIRPLAVASRSLIIPDIGVGEAETIALGLEHEDSLLIIDDALGRKIASLNNLRLTGTLGVLLRAKMRGLVAGVAPLLAALKAKGG